MLLLLGSIAPANADARGKLIAKKRVMASSGGWVMARNGVGLYIPPGVMSRNATVTIRALGKRRWNLHIHGPWSGKVAVKLPGAPGSDHVVAHRQSTVWLREASYAPGSTDVVWVTSLSWFSDKVASIARKACLSFKPGSIVACLIRKKIKSIPKGVAQDIAQKISDSCYTHLIGAPFMVPVVLLTEPACTGTASAPSVPHPTPPASTLPVGVNNGGSQTTGNYNPQGSQPAPASSPSPTPAPANPSPSPAPAPAPSPAPAPAPRGFRVADYYLGGTWARTSPDDGTWYSRSNRPANGAYWYPNGLGVGVDCARAAAAYSVRFADGRYETWNTWFHVTDGKWIPSATLQEINHNGLSGLPAC